MSEISNLEEFLLRNRISQDTWERSGLSWEVLMAIAKDHDAGRDKLADTAEFFAKTLQRFSGVHSVRSRVKDTEHLLEKLIRKAAEGSEKYAGISESNYFEVVADLVGVRALHLFKDDCFGIDSAIRGAWNLHETPVAYVRDGDPQDLSERFRGLGLEIKPHRAGYRSVHYVCSTQPLQRKVLVEVQVRTIFEEGWSEIDHRVRYPNYSDNQLVGYFLTIFNRLAGSADEMGTFVQGLTTVLTAQESKIDDARREKDQALAKMEETLETLSTLRKQDEVGRQQIDSLKEELLKLRRLNAPATGLLGVAASESLRAFDESSWRKLTESPVVSGLLGSTAAELTIGEALSRFQRETGGLLGLATPKSY